MVARAPSMLLERQQETALLERAWRAATGGHGSTWLLCAEAGGGKTRLAGELAASIGATRTRWGAAEPVAPADPYLAVTRLLPGFEAQATRAASVIHALAMLDTQPGPLLIVLDDLHYADDGTVAILVRLAAVAAERPWLVVAAFRPGEGSAALSEATVEIVAQDRARRLDLAPLSCAGIEQLIAGVRRSAPPPAEIEAIYTDSGGNPWFAEVLARGNGAFTTMQARIVLRIDRLERATPGSLALLHALAPATRPLPHALVAGLHGGDSSLLRRTLTALRDAGLLRQSEDGAWGFRHELVRRALLDAMIVADRQDAHAALAMALAAGQPPAPAGSPATPVDSRSAVEPAGSTRHGSAAEIAMHFDEARDDRAVAWAQQAAREARAVDAHAEALAQLERALRFDLEPELRRTLLRYAAQEAYDLARHDEIERLTAEALTIPGGVPEELALLHQLAAGAARVRGDIAADDAHLATAEHLLAGRPPSRQMANIAMAQAARASIDVQPLRLRAAIKRVLRVTRAMDDPDLAGLAETQVQGWLAVSLVGSGDPAGFSLLEEVLHSAEQRHAPAGLSATVLANGYEEAVLSLFHQQADELFVRASDAIARHALGWMTWLWPYRALELAQRGRYQEAASIAATFEPPEAGTLESAVLLCTRVLCEARAGSPDRGRRLLADARPGSAFQAGVFTDLARLDLAFAADEAGVGELAQRVYGTMNRHHYARAAGVAAVALARSGRGVAPPPVWLATDAPLRVFWEWAAGIGERDSAALRVVAERLTAIECPYEAALALRDAGDLGAAYRRLRALGATSVRERVAEQLRAAGLPVPRRSRTEESLAGLTETEQRVCRLVTAGRSNDEIAATLGISVRTVATHLTRIYHKTQHDSRTQLALWWAEHQVAGNV